MLTVTSGFDDTDQYFAAIDFFAQLVHGFSIV